MPELAVDPFNVGGCFDRWVFRPLDGSFLNWATVLFVGRTLDDLRVGKLRAKYFWNQLCVAVPPIGYQLGKVSP